MSIDTKLVDMLSQFMTKTGSALQDVKTLTTRMYQTLDKRDQEKVASISAHRDRAGALAHKLSETRMVSGASFIEGYDAIKQASIMLGDHNKALDLFEMVLDACAADSTKLAAVEPGYPYASTQHKDEDLSADDYLVYKMLGPEALASSKR
jgi:hypothetical protein